MRNVNLKEIESVFGGDLPNEVADLGTITVIGSKQPDTVTYTTSHTTYNLPQTASGMNGPLPNFTVTQPAPSTTTTVAATYSNNAQAAYYTPYAGGPRTYLE